MEPSTGFGIISVPGEKGLADRRIGEEKLTSSYHDIFNAWKLDPQQFWSKASEQIAWEKTCDKIFDGSRNVYGEWFAGAQCNTCYNAIDRHVDGGRADQPAIIYDSPITGAKRTYTYAQLLEEVEALASVLAAKGITKGDRVIIYLPMVPQAAISMLACARIGAIHSVVFGGFAAAELATRIDDASPKLIISASCGIEPGRIINYKPLLDMAIELACAKPETNIILQREQSPCALNEGRDFDYDELVSEAISSGAKQPCVPVAATDPLYILYTSGTTGEPKGVVRDNGGHMVALKWTMHAIYGINPGETWWAASDVGWVVGHSYIVYAPAPARMRRPSCLRGKAGRHPRCRAPFGG